MATSALISAKKYLATLYRPDRDLVDGNSRTGTWERTITTVYSLG